MEGGGAGRGGGGGNETGARRGKIAPRNETTVRRSLSGSLIILECARTGKIYRGRVAERGGRESSRSERADRKESERDGECRHCKPKLLSKIDDPTLYCRYL